MKSYSEFRSGTAVAIVTTLFEARQTTHALHLLSKSYAEHVALDGFYNGLLDLIDEFIEVFQGQYGLVTQPSSLRVDTKADPVEHVTKMVDAVKKARKDMGEDDTHLQNIMDEIIALSYRTIYKLKFLK